MSDLRERIWEQLSPEEKAVIDKLRESRGADGRFVIAFYNDAKEGLVTLEASDLLANKEEGQRLPLAEMLVGFKQQSSTIGQKIVRLKRLREENKQRRARLKKLIEMEVQSSKRPGFS